MGMIFSDRDDGCLQLTGWADSAVSRAFMAERITISHTDASGDLQERAFAGASDPEISGYIQELDAQGIKWDAKTHRSLPMRTASREQR